MTSNSTARSGFSLSIGVKTDPINYRFSFEWLFKLLQDEGIQNVQLGTFFEAYSLPDDYWVNLAQLASRYGCRLSSVFTSHRELGGMFQSDPNYWSVAEEQYRRLIEIGAIIGAGSVGCNPGAVMRDRPTDKAAGIERYLGMMQRLMPFAAAAGVHVLTIEPMSSLYEPPTLVGEITCMADVLSEFHMGSSVPVAHARYCADVSHAFRDQEGEVVLGNMEQLEATVPHLHELHLRNCDAEFDATFGFTPEERKRGIVNVAAVRDYLHSVSDQLPVKEITGYFETSGPKLGRDFSDYQLEKSLRGSLAFLRDEFTSLAASYVPAFSIENASIEPVQLAASMMCGDMLNLGSQISEIEAAGADILHFDVMDGRFVPNMPLGIATIAMARVATRLPFDVHLMVRESELFLNLLEPIRPEYVSVHVESEVHLDRTLSRIRSMGARPGVALNPATPIETLGYALESIDYVLVMTVNPGFAGQKLVPSALRKIKDCRRYLDDHAPHVRIQVDGNVSFDAIPDMVKAGAEILVCGTSSIFKPGRSLAQNLTQTRSAAAEGLERLRRGSTQPHHAVRVTIS